MKRIRVLHCPDIVGGNPQGLARAEREIGLESRAVVFRNSIFSYPTDEILLGNNDGLVKYAYKTIQLFWRALLSYDVVHYNFGRAIFPTHIWVQKSSSSISGFFEKILVRIFHMMDLPILHFAGKCIAVSFQGDDARQGDFLTRNYEISIAHNVEEGYYSPESDVIKRRIIEKFDRYADLIYYLNPDLGHVLPSRAKFVPYSHIDLWDWKVPNVSVNEKPLIIHAPSHRGVKGTQFILESIERLKSEGLNFEFILVEKLPNSEARKIYERADLLIDQLFAGWYGGLAAELMALGKPVISFIRESDLNFIPEKMRDELPVINATAETIYEVLKYWISNREELLEVGRKSRVYVENWHDPLKIAEQMKNDYLKVLADRPASYLFGQTSSL